MRVLGIIGVALLVALSAGSVACSDVSNDASRSASSSPPPTSSSSTQTSTSSESTAASASSESSSPQPCAGGSLPDDATEITHVSGDLDGNGSTDAADVYSSGGGAHVLVELAGNGTASATITDADPAGQAPPRALGVARIGGDRDVVFVQVGSGASTRLVGLYSVRGCDLVRLTLPGHDTFAIGGTVTHLDGLQCSDGTLRVNSATTDDGATYATTAQDARVEDGELVTVGDPVTGTLTSADPGLQTIGSLDCANIDAPL